ncbi:MAG: NifU family protein [Bacteroidales bacterium]|nr:NifU family protein [Bacteroidales bacterium]
MNAPEKKEIFNTVKAAIETVRPYLLADGGDVELVEITSDLVVKVRLTGACHGCPFSVMTLKAGIEQAVRKKLPQLKELVAVD